MSFNLSKEERYNKKNNDSGLCFSQILHSSQEREQENCIQGQSAKEHLPSTAQTKWEPHALIKPHKGTPF